MSIVIDATVDENAYASDGDPPSPSTSIFVTMTMGHVLHPLAVVEEAPDLGASKGRRRLVRDEDKEEDNYEC